MSTDQNDLTPTALAGLRAVADRLASNPAFLAHHIPDLEPDQRSALGLTETQLLRLRLCKKPRPGRFNADAATITGYIGIDPDTLLLINVLTLKSKPGQMIIGPHRGTRLKR